MSSRRLTDRIAAWIESSLDAQPSGTECLYDLTLGVHQGGPTVIVAMFLPGAVLGTMMQIAGQVENPAGATEEAVRELVWELVEQLQTGRQEQIADITRPSGEASSLLRP